MQELAFKKKVSKGSRFNQIYVPKHLENEIGVGDEVEVRLIKKKTELHYSKSAKKLSEFKENLIKGVFASLKEFKEVSQVFLIGSFLFEKIDFRDIDIILVAKKETKGLSEKAYNKLINKFNLKFHVISISEQKLSHLLSICPVTRSMFSTYVSNKGFVVDKNISINKKHLQFLLMLPEDALELDLSSRLLYDSLRRVIAIEKFLDNKDLGFSTINSEIKSIVGSKEYSLLKNNEGISSKTTSIIRNSIKAKLKMIRRKVENGQKG